MDDRTLCILCGGKLIKPSEESKKHNYEVLFQKCENCDSYGYRKDQESKIKSLIKDNINIKDTLLSIAKEKVKDTTPLNTPIIELD